MYFSFKFLPFFSGVSDTSSYNYIIRCGEWDTQSENEPSNHQDRRAKQILFHPGYSGTVYMLG